MDLDAISKSTGKKIFIAHDNSDSSGNYQIIVPAGIFDLVYNAPSGTTYASGILRNVNIHRSLVSNYAKSVDAKLRTLLFHVLDNH